MSGKWHRRTNDWPNERPASGGENEETPADAGVLIMGVAGFEPATSRV
jgi:hypothetical protein